MYDVCGKKIYLYTYLYVVYIVYLNNNLKFIHNIRENWNFYL